MVFLDNASTTKVLDVVAKEMQPYFCDTFYNPGALYSPAFFVHKKVEECIKRGSPLTDEDIEEIRPTGDDWLY